MTLSKPCYSRSVNIVFHPTINPNGFEVGVVPTLGRRESRIGLTAEPEMLPTANRSPDPGAQLDMEEAIAGLPPHARAVFLLYDVEGYQHAEIAEMTGIAEGTSKAQLFRARRFLREALNR